MPPQIVTIHSANAAFQTIETLQRNRHKRMRQRAFFVEGVRAINHAVDNGWQIEAFIYSRGRRLSDWSQAKLANSTAKTHYELPPELMEQLSQKEDPSELLAIVAMPPDDLSRIPVTAQALVVLLDRPASPGNLGSIIRSCDALQASGLVISGHAADLYDPETIRATTGSFFSLPAVRVSSPTDIAPWLAGLKQRLPALQVIGTSAKAAVPIHQHDFRPPTILLIGNETLGLSQSYRALCDAMLTIPMSGSASSLNVASAASIILYEIARQRRFSAAS